MHLQKLDITRNSRKPGYTYNYFYYQISITILTNFYLPTFESILQIITISNNTILFHLKNEDFTTPWTQNVNWTYLHKTLRRRPSAGNYMFKVNNRKSRTKCEICAKLTIKTHQNDASGVVLVSLLLTLNIFYPLF